MQIILSLHTWYATHFHFNTHAHDLILLVSLIKFHYNKGLQGMNSSLFSFSNFFCNFILVFWSLEGLLVWVVVVYWIVCDVWKLWLDSIPNSLTKLRKIIVPKMPKWTYTFNSSLTWNWIGRYLFGFALSARNHQNWAHKHRNPIWHT